MIPIFDEAGIDKIPAHEMFPRRPRISEEEYAWNMRRVSEGFARAMEGDSRHGLMDIMEQMDSSTFNWYMGDVLDRRTYMKYERLRGDWRPYVREDPTIRDFRRVERYWMNGGAMAAPFLQENEQYPYDAVSGDHVGYRLAKYGKKFGLTWESLINDDLMLLRDFPERLAESAVNTEDNFVTRLYAGESGPLEATGANFAAARDKPEPFRTIAAAGANAEGEPQQEGQAGIANFLRENTEIGTDNNDHLSLDSLRAAAHQLKTQRVLEDDDNLPIRIGRLHLVIPQNLETSVRHIFSAREIRKPAVAAGTARTYDSQGEYELIFANDIPSMFTLHVNPWLDVIDGTDSRAWYVFAYPGNSRPPLEVGYLRGHRRPRIFMKAEDSVRIGGGMGSGDAGRNGGFDNDTMDYKMRGVFGGVVRDRRMMLASKGDRSDA